MTGFSTRRYDLDWLRVIAFGLLIFYHIGMFYVSWDWHVKSAYAGTAGEPLMVLVNPWRLALLFFISGVAIRFASDKMLSLGAFIGERIVRLGLPIVFGMAVIIAPQAYLELRADGAVSSGFLAFWPDYLSFDQQFQIITPTWNHLWYVVYLFVYILILAPFLPFIQGFANGLGGRILNIIVGDPVRLLILVIVPFVLYEQFLSPRFPTTHNLVEDWANHAHRFTIFLLGYFAAKNERFWRSVSQGWVLAAIVAVLILIARLYLRSYHAEFYQGLFVGRDAIVMTAMLTLYAWACIVALLGFGQTFLNRPSSALTYLTGAVFCYYIVHQTIIIVVGAYLTRSALGVGAEFALVTFATIVGCVVIYEIVRRVPGLRMAFGAKPGGRKAHRNVLLSG